MVGKGGGREEEKRERLVGDHKRGGGGKEKKKRGKRKPTEKEACSTGCFTKQRNNSFQASFLSCSYTTYLTLPPILPRYSICNLHIPVSHLCTFVRPSVRMYVHMYACKYIYPSEITHYVCLSMGHTLIILFKSPISRFSSSCLPPFLRFFLFSKH